MPDRSSDDWPGTKAPREWPPCVLSAERLPLQMGRPVDFDKRSQPEGMVVVFWGGWSWRENDARFVDVESRLVNGIAPAAVIDACTTGWNKWELTKALPSRSITAGPILSTTEWLEDEHLVTRGYFSPLDHPEMRRCKSDGSPILFDRARGAEGWVGASLFGAQYHSSSRSPGTQ